jgi:hypothetical protein
LRTVSKSCDNNINHHGDTNGHNGNNATTDTTTNNNITTCTSNSLDALQHSNTQLNSDDLPSETNIVINGHVYDNNNSLAYRNSSTNDSMANEDSGGVGGLMPNLNNAISPSNGVGVLSFQVEIDDSIKRRIDEKLRECSSGDSDSDSEHNIYTPKAVDLPSAQRLAKRLYFLDGFKLNDVVRHLSKK